MLNKEDTDLVDAMHQLIYELEQAIGRGEVLSTEIVLALNNFKTAEDRAEKEIDAMVKNILRQAEEDGTLN